jgi:Tol biopolymer transport system component
VRVGRLAVVGIVALAACGTLKAADDTTDSTADGGPDASSDVDVDVADGGARCSAETTFATPVALAELDNDAGAFGARLTHDELTIYWTTTAAGSFRLATASRNDVAARFAFAKTVNGTTTGQPRYEEFPVPSADGTKLYYDVGTGGSTQLVVATLLADGGATNERILSPPSYANSTDRWTYLSPSEDDLWFASVREDAGLAMLYHAPRAGAGFGAAQRVSIDDNVHEAAAPVISADGRTLYFQSNRADVGNFGMRDVYMATRENPSAPFGSIRNVRELNTAFDDFPSWISPDGCRIYISSSRDGFFRIYVAEKK